MEERKRKIHVKGSLALAFSLLCWCSIPIFLRAFVDDIDGWVANGVRYPFATLLWMFPLLHLARKGEVTRKIFTLAIIPAIVNTIAQVFWAWAPYYMQPGMLMFLGRVSILFSILASFALFPDERALIRSAPSGQDYSSGGGIYQYQYFQRCTGSRPGSVC